MKNKLWRISLYALFFINLLLILFFWFDNSGVLFTQGFGSIMLALGRLLGLLSVFFILLQILLIGRTRWIEQLFGLDKLSRLHHLIGTTVIFTIILHPIFLATAYAIIGKSGFFTQLWDFILYFSNVWLAGIAVILFIIIVILSLIIVRSKLKYETWYYIHIFLYAAILLAFFHQLRIGGDFILGRFGHTFAIYWTILYLFVLANLLYFRFFRPIWHSFRQGFVVDNIVKETDNSVSIYIKGKNLKKFPIIPGQFIIWRFFQKGFWYEAHPFSISGYELVKDMHIRLTVKNVGDFTSKIPRLKIGTVVLADGPHGVFTSRNASKEKFLFIAGGVGITPIKFMMEELSWKQKDCILLYGNNTLKDIIFDKEFETMTKRHYHIKVHHILSKEQNWHGENGYVNKEKILRLVKDLKQREIYVCGPPIMMDSVLKSLLQLDVKKEFIHYEKFSL